jgi:hypothetical protein
VLEEFLLGHFTDTNPNDASGTFTVTIDWGDGTPPSPGFVFPTAAPQVFDVLGNHAFSHNDAFTVHVTVNGSNGASGSFTATGGVGPIPIVEPVTFTATPGVQSPGPLLIGHIVDSNPTDTASTFAAFVDWGDGSTNLASVSSTPAPGVFDITTGNGHIYATAGTFTVQVRAVLIATQESFFANSTANVVDPSAVPVLLVSGVNQLIATAKTPPPPPGFLVASFVDTTPEESPNALSVTIDWGDGTTSSTGGPVPILLSPLPGPSGTFDVFSPHTYNTTGNFDITVTVTSLVTGATGTAVSHLSTTAALLVSGTAIKATVGVIPPAPGFLVASFVNPVPGLTQPDFSVTIDWGDGTTTSTGNGPAIILAPVGLPGKFDVFSPHTYATSGPFTVSVTISTPGVSSGSATSTVTFPQPLIASGTRFNALPGQIPPPPGFLVASLLAGTPVAQQNDFTVTVDWGDGSPPSSTNGGVPVFVEPAGPPGSGTFDVFSPHTYAASGTFTITVTATATAAAGGGTATATSTAVVAQQLLASGTSVAAVPGVMALPPGFLVASFVDANVNESQADFTITVDWGDGTPPSSTNGGAPVFVGPVGPPGSGTFDVFSPHTYAAAGTFIITTTITANSSGATVTAVSTAKVSAKLLASGAVLQARAGTPIPPGSTGAVVASVIDADQNEAFSNLSASIDWGDGSPPTVTGTPAEGFVSTFLLTGAIGTFDLGSVHTYATAGTFTATITITDTASAPPPLVSTTATATTTAKFTVSPGAP